MQTISHNYDNPPGHGVSLLHQVVVRIMKSQDVDFARQQARALARRMALNTTDTCAVATSVSELAGNLHLHARGARVIILRVLEKAGRVCFEATARDEGPGIGNIDEAMKDGFSTCGGMGCGLSAVNRLMDEFEIASAPGRRTEIRTRKWKKCP